MKKLICLLLAALLTVGAASAQMLWEEETPQRVRLDVETSCWTARVDARVYGTQVTSAQVYRTQKRNWGKNPERMPELTALLPDVAACAKSTGWTAEDVTLTSPTGARLSLSPWDNTFVGENGVRLREGTLWDVNFNSTVFQEELCVGELDGLPLEDALLKVEPAAQALGITLGAAPMEGLAVTLADIERATRERQALGLPPEQTIILDWTAKDEHYKLLLPQYYHGLRIFPTQGFIPGRENTPQSCVGVIVGREGLEYLQANFVPGAEKAQGAPFAPIPVEQALETGLRALSESVAAKEMENVRVCEAWLCYVPVADKGSTTQYTMTPAWAFPVLYDNPQMWPEDWTGPTFTLSYAVAVDARSGECITDN
ncbi:hypothetical protein [Beduinella massiliensis]|uniref:hypothetical protein n=1 Tax=Beduinella massiliensis TaxID=1852363 RepID=UPI000C81991D